MPDIIPHRYHKQRGPSFICVGPEKTGTSWLYANLEPHPDIFLLPIKEIRYFYEVLEYPQENWKSRLAKEGDWHTQDYRSYMKERIAHYRKKPFDILLNWRRVVWDYRFIFGRRDDNWYLSLFDDAGSRASGDISPQYFSRPEQQKEKIRKLLPKVKILIFLRNPIDWCWSFARMTLIGDLSLENNPDEKILDFFDRYRNYYPTVTAINRWYHFFPPEQIYVGFFDMLSDSPFAFYQEICDFVGIDEQRAPQKVRNTLSKPINKGPDLPIPHRFAVYLAQSWKNEIEQLCNVFSPYPQRWLQRCIDTLGRKGAP